MKKLIIPLATVILFILFFWPSIDNYFFQDDFLHLDISKVTNLNEIPNLFKPTWGLSYRPLGKQGFYALNIALFGINSKAFHTIMLLWFLINIWLVRKILFLIFNNQKVANFGVFFYALSPIHYMSLFWIAAFYFAQGATFFFIAVYFYLRYRNSPSKKYLVLYAISYIIGFLINESVLVLPAFLVLYEIILGFSKKEFTPKIRNLITLIIIGLTLAVFRFTFAGLPKATDYALKFDFSLFSTTRWYLLRIAGLPEGIRFIRGKEIFYALFVVLYTLLMLSQLVRKQKIISIFKNKLFYLGFSWFFLGGLPFFFIPGHLSSYYMEISLVGFIIIILVWLNTLLTSSKSLVQLTSISLLVLYTFLSWSSIKSMQSTHWVSRRSQLAEKLSDQILKKCLSSNNNKIVISTKPQDIDEAKVVLYNNRAVKALCNGNYDVSYKSIEAEI